MVVHASTPGTGTTQNSPHTLLQHLSSGSVIVLKLHKMQPLGNPGERSKKTLLLPLQLPVNLQLFQIKC